MSINLTRNKSVLRMATLTLVAFGFSQLPAGAQSNKTIVPGKTALLGLARGDSLRFSAFNPVKTESGGRQGELTIEVSSNGPGIARRQTLRMTVANLIKLEGREQDPVEVSARVLLYDGQGVVIAQTEARTVPIDWMRSFDFDRETIPLPGELGTGRLQVRAVLKVRCTNVNRREATTIEERAAELLPASVELFDSATGQTQSGTSILEFAVENHPNNVP